jgi:hypothetical protein
MTKAPPGVHPKWLSHFHQDGTYVHDTGEDEEPEVEDSGEVRTFLYRNGEVVEEGTYRQQDFRDVLTEMGY